MIFNRPICQFCLQSFYGCPDEDNELTICDVFVPNCEIYDCEENCNDCERLKKGGAI